MKDKRELVRKMTAKSRLANALLLTRAVLGLVPTVLVIFLVHLFLEGSLSPAAIAYVAAGMTACVAGEAVAGGCVGAVCVPRCWGCLGRG